MTARCHNDSPTVEWSEVTNGSGPAYQADVKLDGTAPLVDGTPTLNVGDNGIQVIVSGEAGNLLQSRASGLFVDQIGAVAQTIANKPYLGIPATAVTGPTDTSVDTAPSVVANPLGVPAIALVTGVLEWFFTVARITDSSADQGLAALWFAYNAQMRGRIYLDDSGAFAVADQSIWKDLSGVVKADDHQDKGDHSEFTAIVDVAAGAELHLKADAAYVATSTSNQRSNVSFDVSQSNPARGVRIASAKVIWIPAG